MCLFNTSDRPATPDPQSPDIASIYVYVKGKVGLLLLQERRRGEGIPEWLKVSFPVSCVNCSWTDAGNFRDSPRRPQGTSVRRIAVKKKMARLISLMKVTLRIFFPPHRKKRPNKNGVNQFVMIMPVSLPMRERGIVGNAITY